MLSNGMLNALRRMDSARKCSDCDLAIPAYPGRYPSACPACGCNMEEGAIVSCFEEALFAISEGVVSADDAVSAILEGSSPFPETFAYDREEDVDPSTFKVKKRPLNSFKEKLMFPRGTVIGT